MNVSLTPELDTFVHDKVESGMYHSASEVIREGLRLMQQRDERHKAQLEQLRKEIQVSFDQVERGEYTDLTVEELPKFFEELQAEGMAMLKARRGEIVAS
jgi:antitoxin ParD1/3/4